ncbi:AMP-binding protein [Maribacter stanieri]|uniref:O-succinylbenzoic acid--CoA ligase n=1 Tax=Maribacter stanieri TaxID=440514 RepID=A0A1I6JTC5_9FLAO|nr:AMP-binding protein [Maribacter stanieri]SFR82206.1 O-succinylbenzoic acid--CoA ligase [Maribacter stanieri]
MGKSSLHPSFAIHGRILSLNDLTELSYSFIKEGEEFEKQIGEFIIDWIDDSSTILVHTSGSTGTPKTIVLKKVQMENSALATGSYFNLSPKSSALLCLPATYIAGKMMLVRAMVLGLDIHFVEPTSNPLEDINRSFDFGAMVPLQVANSLPKLSLLHKLIVGGAPIAASLRKEIKSIANASYETYGMTETITHIAVKPLNNGVAADAPFSILPDVEISKDNRACLVINAPKISDNIIVTNDVVELISPTEFKWLGRFDNIINSGGIKLNPEQIESKLSNILEQAFFIDSVFDAKLGEQLLLVVEGSVNVESLLKDIKETNVLSKYEIPRQIRTVTVFVRTKSGKVKRKETMTLLKA